jgi:hypothetical protein
MRVRVSGSASHRSSALAEPALDLSGARVWGAGHRGMVGSAIVRRLESEPIGELVTATSDEVDLTRQDETESFVRASRPDVGIIAAARVGGIHAIRTAPGYFLYDNLLIAANCVEAARRYEVGKVCILGSSCIYPREAPQPMSEDALLTGPLEETNEGYAIAKGGGITTKQAFGDSQVHVEWASPPEVRGSGQGRGNSGVFLMGRYEIQILDSYENETYYDGQAGALYKQSPPLVNASRKPGEWQTLDIIFTAPRFDEHGQLTRPGYVTVLHNGVVIQNHTEILGSTAWHKAPEYKAHGEKEPLHIQYHGDPVRFRNIWVRELEERDVEYPEPSGKRHA